MVTFKYHVVLVARYLFMRENQEWKEFIQMLWDCDLELCKYYPNVKENMFEKIEEIINQFLYISKRKPPQITWLSPKLETLDYVLTRIVETKIRLGCEYKKVIIFVLFF